MVAVGVVITVTVARGRANVRKLTARCLPTTAVVTAVETTTMGTSDSTVVLPLVHVRYFDHHEREHASTLAISRSWERPRPGQWIRVLYDPEDPDTVLTTSAGDGALHGCIIAFLIVWFTILLAILAGALLIARVTVGSTP
jgi:hypothetical protein